ncbi:MAG: DUF4124 domain-containing protein [Proteobacteria bacterium]|nr:DUF4124 domain-containing protein [Pseudomonadota bacterium]
MRLPALLATALISALALPTAAGTLYRWVDEKGTVNYSSEPPPGTGVKVQTLTPPPVPSYDGAAALAAIEKQNRELQARLDRLQREVEELKQARAVAAAPALPQQVASAPADPCANDPRSNCSRGYGTEYDYLPVYYRTVVVGARPRPLPPFYVVTPVVPGKPVTLPENPPHAHKHYHSTQPATKPAPGPQVNYRAGGTVRAQY